MTLFVSLERGGAIGALWHATGTNGDAAGARSSKSMINGTTGDRRMLHNKTICEFHEFMKKQGHNVDVLRLVDSDHVEHFKTHPREYTEVIRRFLSSLEQSSRQKSQL
ncbi:unnamed protein product [Heligmosomoides polygyrus]|uniref:Peptidase_S9 domain-containing protein n=1 Tax=Heligmosomoides polygyrus TaxID=6339 RepID=A0A183FIQ9_HELPZ|nr:unnamed protein product [Heligmosomoides polygyrus]